MRESIGFIVKCEFPIANQLLKMSTSRNTLRFIGLVIPLLIVLIIQHTSFEESPSDLALASTSQRVRQGSPSAKAIKTESIPLGGKFREPDHLTLLEDIKRLMQESIATANFDSKQLNRLINQLHAGTFEQLLIEQPDLLGNWINSLPFGQHRHDLIDKYTSRRAEVDFDATLTWAKNLTAGSAQDRVLAQLVPRWAEVDPIGLADYAVDLPGNSNALLLNIMGRWAQISPNETAHWAAGLPDGERKQTLLPSIISAWALKDPATSIEFVASLPDSAASRDARISAISALSIQEPDLAIQLVASISDQRLRHYALQNVMIRWVKDDPSQALKWVEANHSASDRDTAAVAGVAALMKSNPDVALSWAELIEDEKLRSTQIHRSLSEWKLQDPQAAENWTKNSFSTMPLTRSATSKNFFNR